MLQKRSIYDFMANVMMIYGIAIASLAVFCALFGEDAMEMSTLFRMGNEGLALQTLGEMLLLAVAVSCFQWLFFTDLAIKNVSITVRTILMFASIIAAIAGAVIAFGWFPVNEILPWVLFLVCFTFYAAVSVYMSVLKEKNENKKMQEALDRLKEGRSIE